MSQAWALGRAVETLGESPEAAPLRERHARALESLGPELRRELES